jgi:hypothetical protein
MRGTDKKHCGASSLLQRDYQTPVAIAFFFFIRSLAPSALKIFILLINTFIFYYLHLAQIIENKCINRCEKLGSSAEEIVQAPRPKRK